MFQNIAICNNIRAFRNNRILDIEYTQQFPGASWVSYFANQMKELGISVVTGDVALAKVRSGSWQAENVWVIQELNADHANELLKLGAKPLIITGFESPLYAHKFYDQLTQTIPAFPIRILFSGVFSNFTASSGRNYPASFPNFNIEDLVPIQSWEERDFLVMVTSNKFWGDPLNRIIRHPIRHYKKKNSPTMKYALQNQLLHRRMEAIEYFGSKGLLKLYGPGWSHLNNLPSNWRRRLKKVIPALNPQSIEDKIKTIASFQFALCFENLSYPGYITEKIIDCFVAGVIPVYIGAPDVQNIISKEAFIDLRDYDSWDNLKEHLIHFAPADAYQMLEVGRNFLKSELGLLYSNKGFTNFIFNILKQEAIIS